MELKREEVASDSDSDSDFDFSRHLLPGHTLPFADELFDCGVIRPLKPLPSPHISKLRPKPNNQDMDPRPAPHNRIMIRSVSPPPLRVSEFALHQNSSSSSSFSSSMGCLKWRDLKDRLLFRSASEGSRALKKHSVSSALLGCIAGSTNFDSNSSFRYAIGDEDVEGSTSSRRHYYRPVSEVQHDKTKKKTYLPYKQGFLGCMGLTSSSSSSGHHQELSPPLLGFCKP